MGDRKTIGEWGKVFQLQNVCCHAALLPTGKILYWGRRSTPFADKPSDLQSLHEHFTLPFILDLTSSPPSSTPTKRDPRAITGSTAKFLDQGKDTVNLFCSGHCFQDDGRLLVAGGHWVDGWGLTQATLYDPFKDEWTAQKEMGTGRWYPSAITLCDGSVMVVSGQGDEGALNRESQILRSNGWKTVAATEGLLLYPRLYLDPAGKTPRGQVFMAGPQEDSMVLDLNAIDSSDGIGKWASTGTKRSAGARLEGSSVMYDIGKIIWTGGGNEAAPNNQPDKFINWLGKRDQGPGTNQAEIIDLNDKRKWTTIAPMKFKRRQHNSIVLPDGTVMVSGGTQGLGFNDVSSKMPVHTPELWDPAKPGSWLQLAPEDTDRCYHGVVLLLPDGRILSAGGGEWNPGDPQGTGDRPNAAKDSHTDAQLFSPPYLFRTGTRPVVSKWPQEIDYGGTIDLTLTTSETITRAAWMRLGSYTHDTNMNQSVSFLTPKTGAASGTKISINAPTNHLVVPPGHYMLFLWNKDGPPSAAPIIRLRPKADSNPPVTPTPVKPSARMAQAVLSLPEIDQQVRDAQTQPHITVGLTPVCPYGLGPCFGAAYEALNKIQDIDVVRPMPNSEDSVAFVYLKEDILPDIDAWREQFHDTANGSYHMRGIEMTLTGVVVQDAEHLVMKATDTRSKVRLMPFHAESCIECDTRTGTQRAHSDAEADAQSGLAAQVAEHKDGLKVSVTGRLHKQGPEEFELDVRDFEVLG